MYFALGNAKKRFAILKKHFRLRRGEGVGTLGIFIVKRVSNDNSNAAFLRIVTPEPSKSAVVPPEDDRGKHGMRLSEVI